MVRFIGFPTSNSMKSEVAVLPLQVSMCGSGRGQGPFPHFLSLGYVHPKKLRPACNVSYK